MSYCSKCGGLVAEGGAFCSKCGTPIGAVNNLAQVPPPPPVVASPVQQNKSHSPVLWVFIGIGVVIALIIGMYMVKKIVFPALLESKKAALETGAQVMLKNIASAEVAYSSNPNTRTFGSLTQMAAGGYLDKRFETEPATLDGYIYKTVWANQIGFCVSAVPEDRGHTSFYIDNSMEVKEGTTPPAASQTPIETSNNPANNPSAPNIQVAQWEGEWTCSERGENDQAGITISSVSDEGFEFELTAAHEMNTGEISGKALFNNSKAVYRDPDTNCQVTFSLSSGVLSIETSPECSSQGGLGVVFDGNFRKR